jgi:hypothetical protein
VITGRVIAPKVVIFFLSTHSPGIEVSYSHPVLGEDLLKGQVRVVVIGTFSKVDYHVQKSDG